MKLTISRSKNAASLYVTKSIYEGGKHTSKVVEKLGTVAELERKLNGRDPIEWAHEYIAELNRMEKEEKGDIMVKYSPGKQIEKDKQNSYNGGYLFLQKIYHELGLHRICREISGKHSFTYNLDSILSRLIYGRVLFPSSKLATYEQARVFLEEPDFELQHVYRALGVIAKETDFIQSEIYKNSQAISKRNTGVLYYDCTNYFFEIEQESGLRQYGVSKERKPNPIVQMGLFMDGEGIPLAFNITGGNTNEQQTLKPLEQQIISDYNLSRFVVCTDAGLSSTANRKFNDTENLAFITTQSIKKLKKHLKEWAMASGGWRLPDDPKEYDIAAMDAESDLDKIFYKERWIHEDDLEQRLIVTFSLKYRGYQRSVRNAQIERAFRAVKDNHKVIKQINQNDYRRFILKTSYTTDGKEAKKEVFSINEEAISKEEAYDGFYGVCTNLEDDVSDIIKINRRRWEIEECFRIMKSEFKARPVYLSRDDRITAHFTVCVLALVLFRFLEKRLSYAFTCHHIMEKLRCMDFYRVRGDGYIPTYTRDDLTDALHNAFGFHTDRQIIPLSVMRNIFKQSKR